MDKKKFVESEESKQYKKQLEELQQTINPKPYTKEEREVLIKKRLEARGAK